MDRVLVSIIIVNYNTKELTKNCIHSLYKNILSVSFEIIVVDNNSNDDSVNYLRHCFQNITIISISENKGFGTANNIGVARSKGSYIFLLNPDTIVIKDIVDIFIKCYKTLNNLNVGVMGSFLISENKQVIHSYGSFPYLLKQGLKRRDNIKYPIEEKSDYVRVDVVVGANMFLEKKIYQQFNGFDENIFLYEEELELQYRMQKAGFISILINERGIIHLKGKSSTSYFQRRCSFISMCYIIRKHLPYILYILYRLTWIFYALMFFKNPVISFREKTAYLKLASQPYVPKYENVLTEN